MYNNFISYVCIHVFSHNIFLYGNGLVYYVYFTLVRFVYPKTAYQYISTLLACVIFWDEENSAKFNQNE
jgi:hypothetical protein